MAKQASKEVRWQIYRLRGTPAAFVGSVMACSEDQAIQKAVKEFEIPKAHQERLMARRQG